VEIISTTEEKPDLLFLYLFHCLELTDSARHFIC
jgi:hypothetical protein